MYFLFLFYDIVFFLYYYIVIIGILLDLTYFSKPHFEFAVVFVCCVFLRIRGTQKVRLVEPKAV